MRVLCVEPDHATAQSIELMLKSEGFNVYTTDLGEEAVDLAKIYDYDIILLELNLPDLSGLEVLRQIRVGKVNTPVMILSGTADIETKVKTFGGGADDYMTKPFHKDELIVRTHAIVRRSKGHAHAVITTGAIAVNLDAKIVEVNGVRVHLTGKEYQMMELLSLRKGSTLTKEMFLNHLYGGMDEPELKIVDVFICKLRKKLGAATGNGSCIETVWGRGYVLRDPKSAADVVPTIRAEPVPAPAPAVQPTQAPVLVAAKAPTPPADVVTLPRKAPAPKKPSVLRTRLGIILAKIASAPASVHALYDELKKHEPALTLAVARSTLAYWLDRDYIKNETGYPAQYGLLPKGRELLDMESAA